MLSILLRIMVMNIFKKLFGFKTAKYANNAKLSDAGDIVLAVSNLQDYITDEVYTQLISYDKCQ